jgi:hypothetical protein
VFESDDAHFRFIQKTDSDGRFAYGTKAMAGGAPVGEYRIQITPSRSADTTSGSILAPCDWQNASELRFVCQPKQNEVTIVLDAKKATIIAQR